MDQITAQIDWGMGTWTCFEEDCGASNALNELYCSKCGQPAPRPIWNNYRREAKHRASMWARLVWHGIGLGSFVLGLVFLLAGLPVAVGFGLIALVYAFVTSAVQKKETEHV